MSKIYAGIGSRRTPPDVLDVMYRLADRLMLEGWILRSGHADGADQTFEAGAEPRCEIYLPWPSFNDRVSCVGTVFDAPTDAAYAEAARHHPLWHALPRGAQRLHARNAHQVLGRTLDDPVSFVVCWTPDGSLDGRGPNTGGTGQALRIAAAHDIPTFNLKRTDHMERIAAFLGSTRALAPS